MTRSPNAESCRRRRDVVDFLLARRSQPLLPKDPRFTCEMAAGFYDRVQSRFVGL